ncbi:hypothetical protein Nepgr_000015 [Nepenthes gracilis]|uniref:Uncharacterized protein n=1 Tax=Nepenthes gracilis TaxID=150966 RepID=A0AAD3RW39_NEPGR|nr:hypothetical protein Nepgr_000015 [Nepenthes gracilis]
MWLTPLSDFIVADVICIRIVLLKLMEPVLFQDSRRRNEENGSLPIMLFQCCCVVIMLFQGEQICQRRLGPVYCCVIACLQLLLAKGWNLQPVRNLKWR